MAHYCPICEEKVNFKINKLYCPECAGLFKDEQYDRVSWNIDKLIGEGHTRFCAIAQIHNDRVCTCGLDSTGMYDTDENWG